MENFLISEQYSVLHFDEYPILFIGLNNQNQIIIGSFIYEDDDDENLLFFHSIVSNATAINFLNRKIPYIQVIREAFEIYIVVKDYNNRVISFSQHLFSEIDADILPLATAFCPEPDEAIVNNFQKNYLPFLASKYLDVKFYSDNNNKPVFGHIANDKFSNNLYHIDMEHPYIEYEAIPVYKFRSSGHKKIDNTIFKKKPKKAFIDV